MPVCTNCKHGRAVERLREAYRRLKEWDSHIPNLCEECRKCESERIGEALKQLEPERDALSAICTKCKGASDNFGGQIHIDAAVDPSLVLREADIDILRAMRSPTQSIVNLDDDTIKAIMRILAEFSMVSDKEAPLIVRKLRGETNQQIADGMGWSQQLVWKHWDTLKRKNPLWGALDNGLQGKRNGGRKPGQYYDGTQAVQKSGNTQPQQAADAGGADDE